MESQCLFRDLTDEVNLNNAEFMSLQKTATYDFHVYVTASSAGLFTRPVMDPNGAATLIHCVQGRRIVFLKIGRACKSDLASPLNKIQWKSILLSPGDYLCDLVNKYLYLALIFFVPGFYSPAHSMPRGL